MTKWPAALESIDLKRNKRDQQRAFMLVLPLWDDWAARRILLGRFCGSKSVFFQTVEQRQENRSSAAASQKIGHGLCGPFFPLPMYCRLANCTMHWYYRTQAAFVFKLYGAFLTSQWRNLDHNLTNCQLRHCDVKKGKSIMKNRWKIFSSSKNDHQRP